MSQAQEIRTCNMTIPSSAVKIFYTTPKPSGVRLGQHFHQFFKLEKVTNFTDKVFCDRLYESDGDDAKKLIESITDYDQ